MDNKSVEMLEFHQVREILASHTSFTVSRELALALMPSRDAEQITHRLKQSAEARHLLSLEPDFSIGGVFDIREPVKLASVGKMLEPQTLLDVQRTLSALRQLRSKLLRLSKELPLLSSVASRIVPLSQLEKEISGCISPAAELLDTASPRLIELREKLKGMRQQLVHKLEAIIRAEGSERFLQEPLITERDGRYVLPVKVELRREFKGIVHDISNTGATAFIEPWVTVELGNELRELVIEEKREVERILMHLSAGIGSNEAVISGSLALAGEIDLALAKARYAEKVKGTEPSIITGGDGRVLKLVKARHPLLKGKAVPLSVELGKDFKILVITGPNTGGKTVALKTIGLLTLMAQAGMPIPAAQESCIPIFDSVFADIGDEQSIEQTLSTFGWHMSNIVRIFKGSTGKSLVLLDELGTSTDPAEGAALAQSILLHFLSKSTMTVATTHFSDLKAFAHTTPGLQNASLDFDPVTLVPGYHLTIGIPGGSNALATAARLGLPAEIITDARARLGRGGQEIETLLADLMSEKQKVEVLREQIEKEKETAENLRRGIEEELKTLKEREQHILHEARGRLVREGDELQRLISDAVSELKKKKSKESIEQARKAVSAMREQLKSETWQPEKPAPGEPAAVGITVGDKVWLRDMNMQGTVLAPPDDLGQVEVQVGQTRVRLSQDSVEKAEATGEVSGFTAVKKPPRRGPVAPELDLRGKRASEVETLLDSYLNEASLANLNEVRIIHGFGTGTVRQIVRDILASHPLVQSFRSGGRGEGGDGVTVVKL